MRQGKYTVQPGRLQRLRTGLHRRWRWFQSQPLKKKILIIGGPILAILILTPILTYLYFANIIADPDRLMNHNRTGIVLEDRDGQMFYSFGTAKNTEVVGLDKIADNAERALIAAEDKDFYDHSGFSFLSILAALWANVTSGDPTAYGGSTITQQLTGSLLLTNKQNYFEKYQELFLAIAIEQTYSKEEILTFYLNSAYFGEGAFGIDAAAKTYFNKSAQELTLAESSMLIGLLPAPSAYSPISGNAEYAKERQDTVLSRMVDEGYISEEQKQTALNTKLAYADPDIEASEAPHFAQMVINQLNEEYGEERVTRSGFVVRTTLDLDWQKAANQYVEEQTAINAPLGGRNAALVAQDPNTGAIRALVGSSDWDNKKFGKVNMAVTPRQPGSSFKPIYYTEAMARGLITPATHIVDEPININGYSPENFDFAYRGDIAVRDALAQSLNIPSVKIMQELGVEEAVDTAQRMGINTITHERDYGLALALGAGEVKLTDMVNAYSAFANGGEQYDQTAIVEIRDKYDRQVYEREDPRDTRVVDEGAAFLISDILSDNNARVPTFGSSLNLSRDTAVKTGSTDDNVDAWTIGFTPNVVVGVWVGNNEHEPMTSGGSGMAGPIWRQMMERAFHDVPQEDFQPPASVEQMRVCASNGGRVIGDGRQGTYLEYFLANHPPEATCDRQQPEDSDGDGVNDENDRCADTPGDVQVDNRGCEVEDEEEEEQTPDNDGDGVPNDEDQCMNTPEGAEVDGEGCETSEGNMLDSDGDGVLDIDDDCNNTPAGEPVDNSGCSDNEGPGGGGGNGDGGGNDEGNVRGASITREEWEEYLRQRQEARRNGSE